MRTKTIAVVAMGDMGHAVGRVLREKGYEVVTRLSGRSEISRKMASRAGVRNIDDMNELVSEATLFLSIVPPTAALKLALEVANALKATGHKMTYIDCNAISPTSVREIADLINAAGAPFIDAGIIGLAPGKDVPRFYVSGEDTSVMEELDGCGFSVKQCGKLPGEASAIKMCYAALTKGTFTLHAALLMAAKSLGVYDVLLEELQFSQASRLEEMKSRVPFIPADAKRWIREMEEIASTFRGAGITGGFHDGAADILKILAKTPFADETRETLDYSRGLEETVNEFVRYLGQNQVN